MKNKSDVKLGEERKGFWRIGYLEYQEYPKRMLELTRRQVDHIDLDNAVEQGIARGQSQFFGAGFEPAEEDQAAYAFFATGQKAYYNNKEIWAGFYRTEDDTRWRGVYVEQDTDKLKQLLYNQRQRSALESYTYVYDYSHIAKMCNKYFGNWRSVEEWANYIGDLFNRREKEGEVFQFPNGSYFTLDEEPDGKQMYFWMEKNDKFGVKQKGFGLQLVDEDFLLEQWSDAQYKYTLDHMVFSAWEAEERFIAEVAALAMPENWGRLTSETAGVSLGYPILKSYLEYTLIRLRALDQHKTGYLLREDGYIYFNTGLLNKFFRQILIGAQHASIAQEVPGLGVREFEFYYNPYPIVSGHDTKFSTTHGLLDFPKIATYFEKKEDVLYDASLEIMLNDEHVFEDGLKEGRIPMFWEEYQQVRQDKDAVKSLHVRVQARIQMAIQRARLLAERNYKLAVPQFWRETGEVQFLLPLYMEEAEYTGTPQCALALRRSKNGKYYEGVTILSLDMAYNNARLIAKPDITWLKREDMQTSIVPNMVYPVAEPTGESIVLPYSPTLPLNHNKPATPPTPAPLKIAPVIEKKREPVEQEFDTEDTLPDTAFIGTATWMEEISTRPNGKGIKGIVLGAAGTVARSLLTFPAGHYKGKRLHVRIVEINPQGTQYLCEPIEEALS